MTTRGASTARSPSRDRRIPGKKRACKPSDQSLILVPPNPAIERLRLTMICVQRLLQVQHGARVPGAEARGARPRRAGDAYRHLRGRPPPRRPAAGTVGRRRADGSHDDVQLNFRASILRCGPRLGSFSLVAHKKFLRIVFVVSFSSNRFVRLVVAVVVSRRRRL